MMNAEKIAGELRGARRAAGEGTAQARLGAALRRIERQAHGRSLLGPSPTPLSACSARRAARATIEQALAATASSPGLERAEERLSRSRRP
jgi:hypothetical protein